MTVSNTAELELVRESVRTIGREFGHSYYAERASSGAKTTELWRAVGEAGFVGVNLPEEYGGGGLGIRELAAVAEELAALGCPLLLLVVSPAICGAVIARFGDEQQRQRWLPAIASGESIMAFAITEPDAGSNSHNLATTAVWEGDGWVLRGTKHYISGVDEAAAILVVARTGTDESTGRGRLSLFVVDVEAPGLSRTELPVEIRAPEKQFTLFFDEVRLDADRLIGAEGEGLQQIFVGLNPERIMTAAGGIGIGRYALEKAVDYARQRSVWGRPIGEHQGIAHPLAEAKIELELARVMTERAAELYDAGIDAGEQSNMAKFAAADAALLCLDRAIQTHGGNGLASEVGLANLWGYARLLRLAPVSREMVLNYVAQHSLGLPKSY